MSGNQKALSDRKLTEDAINCVKVFNSIKTRFCHMTYFHGDKNYPRLFGIGLSIRKR